MAGLDLPRHARGTEGCATRNRSQTGSSSLQRGYRLRSKLGRKRSTRERQHATDQSKFGRMAKMEILFTLLAERYERDSLMITTNLVFSMWDQISKDPMTTAAAVDRIVHHAVILELNLPSYRAEKALQKTRTKAR